MTKLNIAKRPVTYADSACDAARAGALPVTSSTTADCTCTLASTLRSRRERCVMQSRCKGGAPQRYGNGLMYSTPGGGECVFHKLALVRPGQGHTCK